MIWTAVVLLALLSRSAAAQSDVHRYQLGAQIARVASSEFDSVDLGVGGRISWHPTAVLGAEVEFNVYPGEFADASAFGSGRLEGLFGVTVGPRVGRQRVFAKLRPGFVAFRQVRELVCIAIFPPPLSCTVAAGKTVFAIDLGGGFELLPTGRTFVRVDAGDRLMRYPRTVLEHDGGIREGAFSSHDFRFAIGGGLRF